MPTALPIDDYLATHTAKAPKLHRGFDAIAHRITGNVETTRLRVPEMRRTADRIVDHAESMRHHDTREFRGRLRNLSARVRRNGCRPLPANMLEDALAALTEAAARETGLRPYPEQIMGAIAIQRGCLAEMATGEGKTLTIGLGAALIAWRGFPCHVITANDYLVRRDAAWLRPFYEYCHLEVGHIAAEMTPDARRQNYAAPITYVTSKEVVADFLRDRIQLRELAHPRRRLIRSMLQAQRPYTQGCVTRGLHAAIVDEADHILIDEAVTPLIISRPVPNSPLETAVREAAKAAASLAPGIDYTADRRFKDITLKASAKTKARESLASLGGLWTSPARREELVSQALRAREFFKNGEQYVVDPETRKIILIDEFTGRAMPQRSWKQGFHQAVEAKEDIPLSMPTETLARLSFQRFFRLYGRLSGLTGTASEASSELWRIYELPVVRIPTHEPCIRHHRPTRGFVSEDEKWNAIVADIEAAHRRGQPVLAGTRSVAASEKLAGLLEKKDLPLQLLSAVHHQHEASIVAEAGHQGRITIATNMAGRGTDIKLAPGVTDLGGLYVIATEPHESGRVDRQLFGRCARQGDPGDARLFFSFEDELARRFLPAPARSIGSSLLRNLALAPASRALMRFAQKRAQSFTFRQRKNVLRQDDWLDESLSFAGPDIHLGR